MNYREIIEAKYNREAWQQLLHDIFLNKVTFWAKPSAVKVSSQLAKEALSLGKISLSDGESLAVYEVELSDKVDIEHNRRGIRDMLTPDWQKSGFAGAFMFCYRKNESLLRFSYVSETWGFNKEGIYEKQHTNTKRYTYLLGEGRGCRTAVEQFTALKNSKKALSDITVAFSVEALTKQFYKDLFDWFQWAVDAKSGVTFPNNTATERDDREDIETKIIRMITRIMFVWFIKQKELVPNKIFDKEYLKTILKDFDPYSTDVGNYYNAILQNLFFATLNRAIEDEQGNTRKFATNASRDIKTLYRYAEMFSISEDEVVKLFAAVPFLNGGLFECLDKTKTIDGVEQAYNYDGFSRNDKRFVDGRYRNRATVPNILFFDDERGLISILSRYNFTIEENSPEEQQVALDPELLGKVFENLLGAYNPETKETARNQSGSFYTPREIVNYMVDESLIAYLGDTEETRNLFKSDFKYEKGEAAEYAAIAKKLREIKILDPACGSGAFPMGLLNRMVDILCRIVPNEDVYSLKLAIIENCIYGSDIQCIATQITKLRFFISLICNCEKDDSKPNFGIPTLPNLETKFVAADSLITKEKGKKDAGSSEDKAGNVKYGYQTSFSFLDDEGSNGVQVQFYFGKDEIGKVKEELQEVRHEHFHAKTAGRKRSLRERDFELRNDLAKKLTGSFAPAYIQEVAKWNPYDQNAIAGFFDPEWMFGVREGFDIVISNPPYVQLQDDGGRLAKKYGDCYYKTFVRTGDIYCLFYERGCQLLKPNGHLCYITSNKWMRAGYGEKTRDFFANNTNPLLLIDFAGVKIFESATVDTNILLFAKAKNAHKTRCAVANKQNKGGVNNLSDFVRQSNTACDFASSDSWVILSPIEQSIKRKIEAVGTPLKDWDINIYRGVLTGCNEAFIISTKKRNEILANCATEDERKRTADLIRPILRGRDIKRYGYDWANLWLINTHNGIRGKLERIHIEDYPAVKAHLDLYWDKISTRADRGDTPYNLRNCAYLEDFSKPKIVWGEISDKTKFALEARGDFVVEATSFLLIGDNLEWLVCFLNSPLSEYLFSKIGTTTGVGTVRWKKFKLEQLYVPTTKVDIRIFKKLLNSYLITKDTLRLEEIHQHIYSICGLTSEEIMFIESQT